MLNLICFIDYLVFLLFIVYTFIMRKKLCLSCKKEKWLWLFRVNRQEKDNRHIICKNCMKKGYFKNSYNPIKARKWRENNKEKLQFKKKIYRLNNPDKMREFKRKYRKKVKNNINFKILNNLRSRLIHALQNNQKRGKTLVLLGCTIPELKLHLEKTFKNGMNWENYGKEWHIDHVLPCASFDLKIPENQQKCFHFSNLQALWAKENLQKSDKLNYFSKLS